MDAEAQESTQSASLPGPVRAARNGSRSQRAVPEAGPSEAQEAQEGPRLDGLPAEDLRDLDPHGRVVGGTLDERTEAYLQALRGDAPPPMGLAVAGSDTKRALEAHSLDALNTLHNAINNLRALAAKAEATDKLPMAILAMKEVGRLSQVYVQMQVGKTMNLNQTIKHQNDVPDWNMLPAEVRRATLEAIAREVMDASAAEPES